MPTLTMLSVDLTEVRLPGRLLPPRDFTLFFRLVTEGEEAVVLEDDFVGLLMLGFEADFFGELMLVGCVWKSNK